MVLYSQVTDLPILLGVKVWVFHMPAKYFSGKMIKRPAFIQQTDVKFIIILLLIYLFLFFFLWMEYPYLFVVTSIYLIDIVQRIQLSFRCLIHLLLLIDEFPSQNRSIFQVGFNKKTVFLWMKIKKFANCLSGLILLLICIMTLPFWLWG